MSKKKIDTLVDGLLATNERIDSLTERMDDMNETFLANTMYIVKDARDKGQARPCESARFWARFPYKHKAPNSFLRC